MVIPRQINHFFPVIVLIIIFSLTIYAQNTAPSTPHDFQVQQTKLLEELLNEVKTLRQALQVATIANHRAKIAMEQISLQRIKVESLKTELDFISIRMLEVVNSPQEEETKELETEIDNAHDPNVRAQLIKNYQVWKKQQERLFTEMKKEQETLRGRKQILLGQLQIEQSNLEELQDKLTLIDKEIESQFLRKNQN